MTKKQDKEEIENKYVEFKNGKVVADVVFKQPMTLLPTKALSRLRAKSRREAIGEVGKILEKRRKKQMKLVKKAGKSGLKFSPMDIHSCLVVELIEIEKELKKLK